MTYLELSYHFPYGISFPVNELTTAWFSADRFASESEHVTLETDECGYTFAKCDMAGETGNPADVFTGV